MNKLILNVLQVDENTHSRNVNIANPVLAKIIINDYLHLKNFIDIRFISHDKIDSYVNSVAVIDFKEWYETRPIDELNDMWVRLPEEFRKRLTTHYDAYLLITQPSELITKEGWQDIYTFAVAHNLPFKQIIVCTGGSDIEQRLDKYKIQYTRYGQKFQILDNGCAWEEGMYRSVRDGEYDLPVITNKPHKYICLNRRPRYGRWYTLGLLSGLGLFNKGIWTFISDVKGTNDIRFARDIKRYLDDIGLDRDIGMHQLLCRGIDAVVSKLPLRLEGDVGVTEASMKNDGSSPMWVQDTIVKKHQEAYFSVVTESFYNNDWSLKAPLLTEKIIKPVACRMPFILVGEAGSLEYFRRLGYMTFSPWIDESYDLEKDPVKRLSMIGTEIKKLCDKPNNELDQIIKEMQPIIEWNFNRLMTNRDATVYATSVKEILKLGVKE